MRFMSLIAALVEFDDLTAWLRIKSDIFQLKLEDFIWQHI